MRVVLAECIWFMNFVVSARICLSSRWWFLKLDFGGSVLTMTLNGLDQWAKCLKTKSSILVEIGYLFEKCRRVSKIQNNGRRRLFTAGAVFFYVAIVRLPISGSASVFKECRNPHTHWCRLVFIHKMAIPTSSCSTLHQFWKKLCSSTVQELIVKVNYS